MELNLTINTRYKGKFIDKIKAKLNFISTIYLFSIIFIFYSIYRIYLAHPPAFGPTLFLYKALLVICILLILFSPIIFIMTSYNKGFKGKAEIFLSTQNGFFYSFNGIKNNVPFHAEGEINLIYMHKTYAELTTLTSFSFFIPLRELNQNEKEDLIKIANIIKEARTIKK